MVFTPDAPFPKSRGHVIKSKDWNDAITEVQRLDTAKVNKEGDNVTGSLTIEDNVGIGTPTPSEKVEIAGGNLSLWRTGSNSTSQALIFKPHDVGPSDSLRKIWVEQFNLKFQVFGGSAEKFFFQDHNGNVHLTINGNGGNVGIGTEEPRRRLQIGEDVRGVGFSSSDASPNAGFVRWGDNTGWKLHFGRSRESSGGALNTGTTGVLMTMQDNGNVGIGATAPRSRLQVRSLTAIDEGTSTAGAWANFGSNAFFDGTWKRIDTTKAGVNLHMNPDGGGIEFRFLRQEADGSNLRNIAVIGSSRSFINEGNVGIGHTSPQVKLHTIGNRIRVDNGGGRSLDLRVDGSALDLESNGGDLFINNNNLPVHIRNLQGGSSRELKENIRDYPAQEAMEALEDLNPVLFNWRDDEEKTLRLGFIAEDTPEIATSPDKTAIIPMHILAILSRVLHEQQRAIDCMRRELRSRGARTSDR